MHENGRRGYVFTILATDFVQRGVNFFPSAAFFYFKDTKTIKTPLWWQSSMSSLSCTFSFAPASKLSWKPQAQHGFVPKRSHPSGKNNKKQISTGTGTLTLTGTVSAYRVKQKPERTLTSVCVGLSVLTRWRSDIFLGCKHPDKISTSHHGLLQRHHILRDQKQ